MSKKSFVKQTLTLEQQLSFLSEQNLRIDDPRLARFVLSVVGYYRLSAYLLPFKLPHNHDAPRKYKPNTEFNQIWRLYQFDQELKLLVIEAIEKIEIALRASISNWTSVEINPFWYTEREYFKNTKSYNSLMRDIYKIIKDKNEVFINHYYEMYNVPEYPPIWMMIETLSFGSCSKLFYNLKHVAHKKKICDIFNQSPTIMDSWLETLVYVRNICAHHARLWNRWLVNAPMIPKYALHYTYLQERNRRFIACAYVLCELMQKISPQSAWKEKLYSLFDKYKEIPSINMGFASNWQTDPFWE